MDTTRRPKRATDGAGQAREPTCRRVTIPPKGLREAASERSERAGRAQRARSGVTWDYGSNHRGYNYPIAWLLLLPVVETSCFDTFLGLLARILLGLDSLSRP